MPCFHTRLHAHRTPSTLGRCTLLVAVMGVVHGCASYEPKPLQLAAHREAFLARTPESLGAAAFARALDQPAAPNPEVFDPTDGLSAPEAEAIAMVYNAQLRLDRRKAGVTLAGAEHAGLWEDPTIGVDLTRIIQSTPDPWKVFSTIGLTIPLSGRLEIEKRQAGLEHAADLARVAQTEWRIRMELRRAWTAWSALDAQARATREFLERVQPITSVVDQLEQAGEMARTEARLFRIERATAQSDLAALEAQVIESMLAIRRLMGLSPTAPIRPVAFGIGASTEKAGEREEIDLIQRDLDTRSPLMLVAAAEYEVAERTLELAIRRQYPDLHIGPGYGNEDGQDQVLLGLSLPLPVLNGNRRAIAEATAAREVARSNAEMTLEQLVADLVLAETQLQAAASRRRAFEEQIVPLVDAQYADASKLIELGEFNSLVLLESLTRQQDAKVRLIEARRDEALAAIRLDEIAPPLKARVTSPTTSEPTPEAGATP